MDALSLTKLMVEYAETKARLEEIAAQIKQGVLEYGESVNVAGVKAVYYKPSFDTPDYEAAAEQYVDENFDLSQFTTVSKTVRWKEVCEYLGIQVPSGELKPAKVIIK